MEEVDTCDIFECPVCMEFLIDKQPRLLHCGHTFCTPCLKQMAKRKVYIVCPKCRNKTTFSHGVESLAKNIDLSKMMAIQLKNEIKCQMCRNHFGVEYACTKCKKQLICKFCAKRHKKVPALRSHKLWPIPSLQEDTDSEQNMMKQEKCKFHNEDLSYYCDVCQKVLCIVGICKPIHDNHNENIGNVREAINYLEEKVKSKKEQLNDITKPELISAQHVIIGELNMVQAAKNELVMAKLHFSKKELNQIETSIKVIEDGIIGHGKAVSNLTVQADNVLDKHRNREYIYELLNFKKAAAKELEATKQLMDQEFVSLRYLLHHTPAAGEFQERTSKQSLTRITNQELAKKKPELALHLNVANVITAERWQPFTVHEVFGIWDGTLIVLITCKIYSFGHNVSAAFLLQINEKGKLVAQYDFLAGDQTKKPSACAFQGHLFVSSYEGFIAKFNMDDPTNTKIVQTKSPIKHIAYIAALRPNILIVSESGNTAQEGVKIVQYNMDTGKVTVNISNIINPGQVCVVPSGKNTKYVVTCRGQNNILSPNVKVNIYNSMWSLVSTIETINSDLRSPIVTPCGKLLLVEIFKRQNGIKYFLEPKENRIVQYDLEGNFRKEIYQENLHSLDPDNANMADPCIAYTPPYLWLAESIPLMLRNWRTLSVFLVDNVRPPGFKSASRFKVKLESYINSLAPILLMFLVLYICGGFRESS